MAKPPPISQISIDVDSLRESVVMIAVGTLGDVDNVSGPASSVSGMTMLPAGSTNASSLSRTISPRRKSLVLSVTATLLSAAAASSTGVSAITGITVAGTSAAKALSYTALALLSVSDAAAAASCTGVTETGAAASATTGTVPSRLGMMSQLPALSLLGSLSVNASGFAWKIALTAGHSFVDRFSMRLTMPLSVSPTFAW